MLLLLLQAEAEVDMMTRSGSDTPLAIAARAGRPNACAVRCEPSFVDYLLPLEVKIQIAPPHTQIGDRVVRESLMS